MRKRESLPSEGTARSENLRREGGWELGELNGRVGSLWVAGGGGGEGSWRAGAGGRSASRPGAGSAWTNRKAAQDC